MSRLEDRLIPNNTRRLTKRTRRIHAPHRVVKVIKRGARLVEGDELPKVKERKILSRRKVRSFILPCRTHFKNCALLSCSISVMGFFSDEGLRDHQRGRGDEEGGERKRPRHEAEKNKSRREGHDRAREKSKKDNEKRENERDERRHEERKHEGEHDSTRQEKHETEQNEQHESRKRPNEVGNSDKSVENSEKLEVTTTDSKSAANDKEKLTVNKFAKHSSNETVLSARERYLARQKTRAVVVQTGSDDEN